MAIHIVLDCTDPQKLAEFWSQALGYAVSGFADQWGMMKGPHDGDVFLQQKVPEPKTGKNRLHLDVRSQDFATAVEQALALGATRADDIYAGGRWQVLRDPEGNEFCILRPRA